METKTRVISTQDGRDLRILEAGVLDGIPVLVHHATPGSRLVYAPWVQDAEERSIHWISYDRPGYGGSTPQPRRTVASAAEDVAAIAKELNLNRLAVWGLSGGGPHALACAALLPDLVVAAASLASPAPYQADRLDWFAGMIEANITEFRAALQGRQAVEQVVEAARSELLNSTPATQDFGGYLLDNMRQGIRPGQDGWMDDDLALVNAWGFEPSQIRIPVLLMQGVQDKIIPFSHGKWLVNNIPTVTAHFLPEDGHLAPLAHRIPDVHAWLISKM